MYLFQLISSKAVSEVSCSSSCVSLSSVILFVNSRCSSLMLNQHLINHLIT